MENKQNLGECRIIPFPRQHIAARPVSDMPELTTHQLADGQGAPDQAARAATLNRMAKALNQSADDLRGHAESLRSLIDRFLKRD